MRRICIIFLVLFAASIAGVAARDYFTLQGGKLAGEELVTPEKTILLFWTIQCPYCYDQLKLMADHCAELERRGFTVRLVNVGEPQGRVMRFVQDRGLGHCQVVLDESATLYRKFLVQGFPSYLFYYKGRELMRANLLSEATLEKALKAYDSPGVAEDMR